MSDFIRWKEVDILAYLPFFIAKSKEFKATNDADSREHERIRLQLLDLLLQVTIQTGTYTLSKWEEFLDITPKSEDLDIRRKAIIEKLNRNESSTKEFLERIVNQYIADESAVVTTKNEEYAMDITFNKDMCTDIDEVIRELETYKPAHIGYTLWEEMQVQHDLRFGAVIAFESDIFIDAVKELTVEDMAMDITVGGLVVIEEANTIGGI